MKKARIAFWLTTVIVALMMLYSGSLYLTSPEMKEGFVYLGFPSFFRIELGIAKLIGAVVLLLPVVPYLVKLAAYFGFAFTFVSAFITHVALGDPLSVQVMPLVFLGLLSVSFAAYRKTATVSENQGSHVTASQLQV